MKLYKCDLCSKEIVEDDVVYIRTTQQLHYDYEFEICANCLNKILKHREYLKNRKKSKTKKDEEA